MDKFFLCSCKEPKIDHWDYHIFRSRAPQIMPRTSLICTCGGVIEKLEVPEKVRETIMDFWANWRGIEAAPSKESIEGRRIVEFLDIHRNTYGTT
jgi:hypothetical protein